MKTERLLGGMAQSDADRPVPVLREGNSNCGGCGMSMGLQFFSRAVGHTPVQIVIPACCGIVTAGPYPYSAYGAPVVASTFAAAAAMATGLARAAAMNGDEDTRVVCWAGDGGTYDIGMATVSAAAERDEDVLYICYDNEIYGNTGGQRSSATPLGAVTTTTPFGKLGEKKDILGIMFAHHVPYAATISLAHPEDALRKFSYALNAQGFRFLHILSPCPVGWKSDASQGVELVRLAVCAGLFPVVELEDGGRLRINVEPELSPEAQESCLDLYFNMQGRFRKSDVDHALVRKAVNRQWRELRVRARMEG